MKTAILKMVLSLAAVAFAMALDAADGTVLRVGFARVDITPPQGTTMSGYYIPRHVKSVLDRLEINCVAFSDGGAPAFVMQFDNVSICDRLFGEMREAIVRATGTDPARIFIHSSHTHDGGRLAYPTKGPMDQLYIDFAKTRAADVAVQALRDLRPARLSGARSEAKRISFGRNYLMRDGSVRTNPGVGNPDVVGPVGNPPDEEVQVLRIDREGAKAIAVINFQTHPDVIGGETVSADWPGLTRTVFEAATGREALALVLNGCEGDVNHVNVCPRPGERNGLRRDFDDVDRGYDHARHMANVVAGAALRVWLKCAPLAAGRVSGDVEVVRVPSNRPTAKELVWAEDVWTKHQAGRDAELPWKGMKLTTEVARAGRMVRLKDAPETFEVPVAAVTVGDVAFAGFPGEPFNDIGKAVKRLSPFAMTIPACLTNGDRGYFPFSDDFKRDAYEAASSEFGPSVADDLIAGQLRLLKRLHP